MSDCLIDARTVLYTGGAWPEEYGDAYPGCREDLKNCCAGWQGAQVGYSPGSLLLVFTGV